MNARRPLHGVALLFFINGAALGSWLPRLPELRDRLQIDLATVGFTLAMGGIGGLIGSAVSGFVVGRVGARRTAVWPALALTALLPGVGFAPTALWLGLVVGLGGVVDSLADVGMNALAVRAQESRPRSIFTRLHALWSLGSVTAAAVSSAAAAAGVSLALQLVVIALASGLGLVWAGKVIPATEARPRLPGRPRLALGVGIMGAAVALVEGAPHDWSALFLTDVLRASPGVAGLGFLFLSAGMVVGRLLGDRVVDRVGPLRSIFAGLTVVAISLTVTVVSRSVAVSLAALAAWGVGVSVILPLLYRLAGSHRSFGEGSGLAALTVGNRLGFMAGPTVVGSTAALTTLPLALALVVSTAVGVSALAVSVGFSN